MALRRESCNGRTSTGVERMTKTCDGEIRRALHCKKLSAYHDAPDSIVIDELGLAHAKARVDVAVINGCVHGYEIKSGVDTLERLPRQLDLYRQCLGMLTIVADTKHVDRIERIVPDWTGVIAVKKGSRGAVAFSTVRRAKSNPELDKFQLAHLLWKSEAVTLLSEFGASSTELRAPRKALYEAISKHMTAKEMTAAIRKFMVQRSGWIYREGRV